MKMKMKMFVKHETTATSTLSISTALLAQPVKPMALVNILGYGDMVFGIYGPSDTMVSEPDFIYFEWPPSLCVN